MQPVTILITEDDRGHAILIESYLRRNGVEHPIVRFGDGQQLLDFFSGRAGGIRFNPSLPYLLLLDIRMPKINGVDVLRYMRTCPQLGLIPTIVLTTTDDPREIRECYELGCKNYIVKPIAIDQFGAAIQQVRMLINILAPSSAASTCAAA